MALKEGSHSSRTGFTECRLLVTAASHEDCQVDLRNELMWPLKSVKGNLKGETLRVRAALAAESAWSLPRIPTWLGSQQKKHSVTDWHRVIL